MKIAKRIIEERCGIKTHIYNVYVAREMQTFLNYLIYVSLHEIPVGYKTLHRHSIYNIIASKCVDHMRREGGLHSWSCHCSHHINHQTSCVRRVSEY